jgi:short subunit dehydrogenase-like uncharacterized protein
MTSGELLIYGANGYSGELIAREAAARALRPVLAGRRQQPVAALATDLSLPHRVFPLDDAAALAAGLRGVAVVLHCAGPFRATSAPMAQACLAARAHYLDITGELAVFRALLARDADARAAGVTLLPGAGLDVVPSDGLAAALARRLPGATRLELALLALGGVSHGTALTMIEMLGQPGAVCRGGRLQDSPLGALARDVDFGRGPVRCLSVPWGDVLTAHVSTGIPDITTYIALPRAARLGVRLARWSGGLLVAAPVRRLLAARVNRRPGGPSREQRNAGRCFLWGEVRGAEGARAEARMMVPEGYAFTVQSSLALAQRALRGELPPGFQTPSRACGADFVLGLPGVRAEGWREPATAAPRS